MRLIYIFEGLVTHSRVKRRETQQNTMSVYMYSAFGLKDQDYSNIMIIEEIKLSVVITMKYAYKS